MKCGVAAVDKEFWRGRRVFVTGHTGFKGAWLSIWLEALGAQVTGYALAPPTEPSLFDLTRVAELCISVHGDVRDLAALKAAMHAAQPEVVLHLAAQPLVRQSYRDPVETYQTNVLGTVHLLEAVRQCASVRAVVVVTTDKVYENREWCWSYRENDQLGGYDPYASSKACAELVVAAYRRSYFSGAAHAGTPAVASARAGTVIGGGDYAPERLVPDCVRAVVGGAPIVLRAPGSVRPWQHVLEPLCGYLVLAQRLYQDGQAYAQAWNFGPDEQDCQTVEDVVRMFCGLWGDGACYNLQTAGAAQHEAGILRLDCALAHTALQWRPQWHLDTALARVVAWVREYMRGTDLRACCRRQIEAYHDQMSTSA